MVQGGKLVKAKKDPSLGRRQKALLTRRRMIRAATELFAEFGYAGTTMDAIAERAEVAVQTLYFTFNTKSVILEECVGAAIVGLDNWDPRLEVVVAADPRKAFVESMPWFADVQRAKTAAEALSVFVAASITVLQRVAPLVLVQTAAAGADAQVRAARDVAEQRRVEGYTVVVETLAKRSKLRRGMTVRRATDVVLTILSAETYQQLRVQRGWSANACKKWCADVLQWKLFGE